jgi:cytochrome P450
MQPAAFAFDPLAPEFQADPYPFYELLRENMPQFYWQDWNMWFFSRHEDCAAVLKDSRFGHEILNHASREELGWGQVPEEQRALSDVINNWMLNRDPPDHTRLRGLVHKAFTPRMVEHLREFVRQMVIKALNQAQDEGGMEVVSALAYPVPVAVIAELLGVPNQDRAVFSSWSRSLAMTLELTDDERVYSEGSKAADEFRQYFQDLIAERRRNPKDDLLSALVMTELEGDRLNERELISMCVLLLVAGHETTVNLIGNGTLALLRHPDQYALLCADPDGLSKSAVEELLRYDSPVQLTTRFALEEVDMAGQHIRKGQQVATLLGAANRDPARFNDPSTLDITRADNPHLAFGSGIHYCVGSPLARLEAQIVFSEMARRFPMMQLMDDNPLYRKTYVLRGVERLNVSVK